MRWIAEPCAEGGQVIGNIYELRPSTEPDMAELWVSVNGRPMKLFRVRPRQQLVDYCEERVRCGWFSAAP